jgi:hypothetical protein
MTRQDGCKHPDVSASCSPGPCSRRMARSNTKDDTPFTKTQRLTCLRQISSAVAHHHPNPTTAELSVATVRTCSHDCRFFLRRGIGWAPALASSGPRGLGGGSRAPSRPGPFPPGTLRSTQRHGSGIPNEFRGKPNREAEQEAPGKQPGMSGLVPQARPMCLSSGSMLQCSTEALFQPALALCRASHPFRLSPTGQAERRAGGTARDSTTALILSTNQVGKCSITRGIFRQSTELLHVLCRRPADLDD